MSQSNSQSKEALSSQTEMHWLQSYTHNPLHDRLINNPETPRGYVNGEPSPQQNTNNRSSSVSYNRSSITTEASKSYIAPGTPHPSTSNEASLSDFYQPYLLVYQEPKSCCLLKIMLRCCFIRHVGLTDSKGYTYDFVPNLYQHKDYYDKNHRTLFDFTKNTKRARFIRINPTGSAKILWDSTLRSVIMAQIQGDKEKYHRLNYVIKVMQKLYSRQERPFKTMCGIYCKLLFKSQSYLQQSKERCHPRHYLYTCISILGIVIVAAIVLIVLDLLAIIAL